jgi:dolichol-phosphate mannosyltransferase
MGEVTVVAAVLNEGENIGKFMHSLDLVDGVGELVIVDDGSTDSTLETVKSLTPHYSVRIIQRERKMGTVSAQIAGAREAGGKFVVVMDADMQHDPSIIGTMYGEIKKGYDIVIASRMVEDGASSRPPVRGIISRGANFLAHLFIPQTKGVKDIMSGYFIARREIVAELKELNDSYKILLYIFASRKGIRYAEVPYRFRPREGGESKVVSGVDFLLRYLAELMHYVRVEFNVKG